MHESTLCSTENSAIASAIFSQLWLWQRYGSTEHRTSVAVRRVASSSVRSDNGLERASLCVKLLCQVLVPLLGGASIEHQAAPTRNSESPGFMGTFDS